ncbi:ATP-binding protein [Streptomyces armeniacus]|uniref:histidine kinase n=1 Tax=Streptomyces armeniacus TaxID=83291 RepID=A0A345XWV8_9ACTN|nr:histidine kinase [Streptomyces armeniacus]AXK36124.1 ATP-binding protein [Streptomyces armeniacus]
MRVWSGATGSTRRRAGPALVRDGALWALLAAAVVTGDAYLREPPQRWWLTAAGLLLLGAATGLARRRPVAAWLLAAALALAASPQLLTFSYGPALAAFGYLLGRRCAQSRPALVAFAGVVAVGTASAYVRTADDGQGADPVLVWLVMTGTLVFGAVFPWTVGRYRRQDRELFAAGWDRAERLEREQRIVAEQARLRERARIAEDMHDALGHDLSLIALRAGALQVAPGLEDEHRQALAGLRGEAARATERLRDIIGVLREPAPDRPAPDRPASDEPALGERASGGTASGGTRAAEAAEAAEAAAPLAPVGETLASLVTRAAASGLPVRLVTDGAAESAPGALPPPADRAAYRVVREALTNAAKHAPGAEVTVAVDCTEDGTAVSVRNGPPAAGATTAPAVPVHTDDGTGLVALRERVRLACGGLTAGPSDDGGFTVTARFPADPQKADLRADVRPHAPAAGPYEPGAGTHAPAVGPYEPGAAARQFAAAQRAARRRTARATALACGAAALVVAAVFGWYAYTTAESVLPRATYDRLRVGDPEDGVRDVLPGRQESAPSEDRSPPPPPGARCAYYRTDGRLFTSVDIYRLCFRNGTLAGKTVIQGAGDER